MATSQDFATWTCGEELLPRFLLHALRAMSQDLRRVASGSTHKTIYMPDIEQLRVPLPSVESQRRIADFLDGELALLTRIEIVRRRQIEVIKERQSAFERLAVAGVIGESGMATGVPWIGRVHHRGKVVPLGRVATLQRGVDLTDAERRPGEIPVITTAGMVGTHERAIAQGPGVVVGRYGSAGSVHWVSSAYWPHNTTLYVKNFHGNRPRYCYYLLRSLPYKMEQERSAVPGLNRNDLHKRLVPWLPLELQDTVVERIDVQMERSDRAVQVIADGLKLLAERRLALITAAVTGQIDVTTARGAGG